MNKRLGFRLSASLVLKIFVLPLSVGVNPLVKAGSTGVEFWLGPTEFWFSVTSLAVPHTRLPLLRLGVVVSSKVSQAPSSARG